VTTPSWDAAYAASVPPPWDLGRDDTFDINPGIFGSTTAEAWLATISRLPASPAAR